MVELDLNAMLVRRLRIRIKGNPKQGPGDTNLEDKVSIQMESGSK